MDNTPTKAQLRALLQECYEANDFIMAHYVSVALNAYTETATESGEPLVDYSGYPITRSEALEECAKVIAHNQAQG